MLEGGNTLKCLVEVRCSGHCKSKFRVPRLLIDAADKKIRDLTFLQENRRKIPQISNLINS